MSGQACNSCVCKQVKLGAELGRGSFAVTCEGMLCGELVAVKITKLLNNDSSSMLFLRELSILTNLSHPNLLGFKGDLAHQSPV